MAWTLAIQEWEGKEGSEPKQAASRVLKFGHPYTSKKTGRKCFPRLDCPAVQVCISWQGSEPLRLKVRKYSNGVKHGLVWQVVFPDNSVTEYGNGEAFTEDLRRRGVGLKLTKEILRHFADGLAEL
jgi:hypothetical protein